jgi:hypothetical protein
MRGLAFATRRGTATPRHTPSARIHARSTVCAPSGHGSGSRSCRPASRRERGGHHGHRAPPHASLRRAHIGHFKNRRSVTQRRRASLMRVRPRVLARVCRRVRVQRKRGGSMGRRCRVGRGEKCAWGVFDAQAGHAARVGAQRGRPGRTNGGRKCGKRVG